ncbi:MAG TPA: TetR/AcrR family transcriptional regulator [Solirubrobacterales bacterium]|jgi:AcrR family transcriptional regulator|nr:TetR/AcrR family transcriptional regulator [Solirubrobacterales bacterium]
MHETSSAAIDDSESISPIVPFPGHRVRRARERLLEAMLVVSGERGYEQISVQDVIEAAHASRATFYKHFKDKDDCFAQAYHDAAEWLYRRLIGVAKRQPGWREGLRAGMAELLEFCANQPYLARALIVETHAAGGAALAEHNLLMERLSHAIDRARREIPSRQAPPPITATFMVGAIETLVRTKLMSDEPETAPEMLPGLLHFVVMQYFGEDAAWEEMTAAPLATWATRREAATRIP